MGEFEEPSWVQLIWLNAASYSNYWHWMLETAEDLKHMCVTTLDNNPEKSQTHYNVLKS